MHRLVLILFNLINTTQQPPVEPTVCHHEGADGHPHPTDLFHNMLASSGNEVSCQFSLVVEKQHQQCKRFPDFGELVFSYGVNMAHIHNDTLISQ